MIHDYGKVYNLGHRAVAGLFEHPTVVQEKIDGSQISFAYLGGGLRVRSKGAIIDPDAPPKLFSLAVATIRGLADKLIPGYTYRGEAVCTPKHNTLVYDRIPHGGVILFDVDRGLEDYMLPAELATEGQRLGLEVVPAVSVPPGKITLEVLRAFLDNTSILGGQKVEGVVIKAYNHFDADGKLLKAKHVSEAFKEVHQGDWKTRNPGRADVIAEIVNDFGGPARWQKAVTHRAERGELVNAPQDIGPLIREIVQDLLAEEREAIANILFKHFERQITSGVTRGFAEWYKNKLMEAQFDGQAA